MTPCSRPDDSFPHSGFGQFAKTKTLLSAIALRSWWCVQSNICLMQFLIWSLIYDLCGELHVKQYKLCNNRSQSHFLATLYITMHRPLLVQLYDTSILVNFTWFIPMIPNNLSEMKIDIHQVISTQLLVLTVCYVVRYSSEGFHLTWKNGDSVCSSSALMSIFHFHNTFTNSLRALYTIWHAYRTL